MLVRVWLPDRPGALGLVASRIGSVGADIVGVDVVERGDPGDARVARRCVDLGAARVEGQGTGERVLAATGSDHEGLHGPSAYRPAKRRLTTSVG